MAEDTEVREEVVQPEELVGAPSAEAEPVSDESVRSSEAEELERLKRQMREFQSRADRAEAELKELRRREMSDVERMQDELAEKERELEGYRTAYAQLMMERKRAEIVRKHSIPPDLEEFVPLSYDELEMEEKAKKLAMQIQQLTKSEARAPVTGGGAPPSEPTIDALIQEAREKGDVRGLLQAKLSRLRGG